MIARGLIWALVALAPLPVLAQDLSGRWDVRGQDPRWGAFQGVVALSPQAGGYRVLRLVEVTQPLPDGRLLALAWEGDARLEPGGLRVHAALRRCDFVRQLGALQRGPQDRTPLDLSALLAPASALPAQPPAGTQLSGVYQSGLGAGASETWTRSAAVAPPIPTLQRRLEPLPVTCPRGLFFRLFRQYHQLPEIAPSASRPEFQAAVHFQMVDDTGRAWSRAHPDRLLVVQKVPDAIALHEEDLRVSAFRWSLHQKEQIWDQAMLRDHLDPVTGMVSADFSGRRLISGDAGLHQGVWVASQAYRYLSTGEAAALTNVEAGLRTLVLMVDAPGDPKEFARAVSGTPGQGWTASPSLPGIYYLPGGNNDMLHGVDYGFSMGEEVLPPGHPLLAEMGSRAARLVANNKTAKGGTHELLLSGVAARQGVSGMRRHYRRALWSPLELLWLATGEGVWLLQEISGKSGPHLATTTMSAFQRLGGSSPGWLERIWRWAARRGARFAYDRTRGNRPGNLASVAALAGHPDAGALAKAVLAEIPCPAAPNGAEIDWTVNPAFCFSPYPMLPWKLDFIQNVIGRRQSLVSYPRWTINDTDNYWKEGPYRPFQGQQGAGVWSRQDWLHAYWIGRQAGAIAPSD